MLQVIVDQEPSSQAPMFERYTARARRVLFFARHEAGRAGSAVVSATRTSLDEPGSFGWVDFQTPASAPASFIGFSDPPWPGVENDDRLGLAATYARRNVTVLVVRNV